VAAAVATRRIRLALLSTRQTPRRTVRNFVRANRLALVRRRARRATEHQSFQEPDMYAATTNWLALWGYWKYTDDWSVLARDLACSRLEI
jgi:hypothetical protein